MSARLPRDLPGDDLVRALRRLGYRATRQSGSHMRLTTAEGGEHHVTIPRHDPLRVGTLDDPDVLPPDIHIFTASKQPWVVLPDGIPAVPEYYDREKYWPEDSKARRRAILPLIEAYQASRRTRS